MSRKPSLKATHRGRSRPAPFAYAGMLLIALATAPLISRADTVASLLGNFTINQFCGVNLTGDSVSVHYAVVFGQLPALRELHLADVNGDGVTSQAERDAYAQRLAPEFARSLKVLVDGAPIPLHLRRWASSLPTEQGGFSLRLDADFTGRLPAAVAVGDHRFNFINGNFASNFGWHEITVQTIPAIRVSDTNAFNNSLTAGLAQALKAIPASGPLDERAVHLSFGRGAAPAGSALLGPRPGTLPIQPGAAAQTPERDENNWLQRQTRHLIGVISARHVEPAVILAALLAAFVLGALHAFSPGHGKTIVGAYLIGSRGTPKHAAFLGLTVTVTHTLGVFVLGFATLFASRFIFPDRLFPILSLISGLIVLAMGMILLAQRWHSAKAALARRTRIAHSHSHSGALTLAMVTEPAFTGQGHAHNHEHDGHQHSDHWHDHGGHTHHRHGHDEHLHDDHDDAVHTDDHHHDDSSAHNQSLLHSHGGRAHSHLPPGADGSGVTWRSLLALGISGGLVPCPSALVLLLAAVALNKTAYGMLLVLGFSIGLAATLTIVGLAFLYARDHFRPPSASARWPHLLPVLSAGLITAVGVILCFGALRSVAL
jgi:nickel/cobalt exporter